MLDHHADDLDMLPVGVHGRVIVIERHQLKHLLPILINAAGPVLLEGGLFAAVLGDDIVTRPGLFIGVDDDQIPFIEHRGHGIAAQPETKATGSDIDAGHIRHCHRRWWPAHTLPASFRPEHNL